MFEIWWVNSGAVYTLPDCKVVVLACEHTVVDILPSNDGKITLRSSSRKLMVMHDTVEKRVEIAEDPNSTVVIGGNAVAIGLGAMAVGAGGVAVRGSNYGNINVSSGGQATVSSESVATLCLPSGIGYIVSCLQMGDVRDQRGG